MTTPSLLKLRVDMKSASPTPENVFSGLLLDRNAEQRDDAAWIAAQLADPRARFVLLGAEGHALAQRDVDALRVILADERSALLPTATPSYLGADDAGPFFSLSAESRDAARIAAELGGDFIDLRSAGTRLQAFEAGLFAYARALSHWQSRTRFCSVCGAPVVVVTAGHRARCTNPDCAIEHFPRVDPAMIVIVSYGDACLLGRQATWPEKRFSRSPASSSPANRSRTPCAAKCSRKRACASATARTTPRSRGRSRPR